MTPAARLTCTVQVEGAVHAVPLVPGKNLPALYLFKLGICSSGVRLE